VGKDKISASEISGSTLAIGRIREHDIDCYERAIVKMIVSPISKVSTFPVFVKLDRPERKSVELSLL